MPITIRKSLLTLALGAVLSSSYPLLAQASVSGQSNQASNLAPEVIKAESAKANALFEAIFNEDVAASPVRQTFLGIKTDYGKWDSLGDAADDAALARAKQQLERLSQLDPTKLDSQSKLSLELLTAKLQRLIRDDKFRHYNYPVNQMYGIHSLVPSLLINQHSIADEADAHAYISRIAGVPELFEQLITALEVRAEEGIIAPKFVFPHVLSDSRNIIHGAPFDGEPDSAIWADFKGKLAKLKLDEDTQDKLLDQAAIALKEQLRPAYQKLIAYLETLEKRADSRDGVWKFPSGSAFYNNALANTTTTEMSADTIHQLGLDEVARIHGEMRAIMDKVGFKGDLKAFFEFMRQDEGFYFPDNDAGRRAYLREATALIDNMNSRLDEVFKVKPKAPLIVKQVEAFREKSAGKAFYNQPSADGSRPGTYYANLYDIMAMPKYQMEALAYHEGIPGHHMQIAIAQELEGLPSFRRFGSYTAYIEGWGLYSEYFPKEMGLYSNPYSDFGRLAMELWRSCRLVVDTGIHAKKWTREQAIAYYMDNTPNAESDAVKMVERHIVMPSQATAYKVGMNKILALRAYAKEALGERFDIRAFHTLVLQNGPLPLDVLEQEVKGWVAAQSQA